MSQISYKEILRNPNGVGSDRIYEELKKLDAMILSAINRTGLVASDNINMISCSKAILKYVSTFHVTGEEKSLGACVQRGYGNEYIKTRALIEMIVTLCYFYGEDGPSVYSSYVIALIEEEISVLSINSNRTKYRDLYEKNLMMSPRCYTLAHKKRSPKDKKKELFRYG